MIERYEHSKHSEMVRSWLEARGLSIPPPDWLPDFGLVADGIAVAFLVKPNSGLAQIENVAADPETDPLLRDLALIEVINALEKEATSCGYKAITILGSLPSMKDRLRRLSYVPASEFTLFSKLLGGRKCLG